MKKNILFFIGIASFILSLASCMGEGDETPQQPQLTPEQMKTCLWEVAGHYSGKLYCNNPYYATSDSTECEWSIQDSTLTVQISKRLVVFAATNTTNKLVTEDVRGVEQKFTLHPEYTTDEGTLFYMIPKEEKLSFESLINEKTSKVEMLYASYLPSGYNNYISPICQFSKKKRDFIGNILVYGVKIDGGSKSASTLMVLSGHKDY